MEKRTRRGFFRDAAALLLLPATAGIASGTLEDILGRNRAHAQPPVDTHEQLSFMIGLQNYETHSIIGRINQPNAGSAVFDARHTSSTYSIQITANIGVRGSWVRMQTGIRGAYAYVDAQPQFRPQSYWLHYSEGGSGTTAKTFHADTYFDLSTCTARSYGYHDQQGRPTERYGSPNTRVETQFHPSTRDLFSAMMEARFLPAQERRQINTIVEGRPRSFWLEYLGNGRFQPAGAGEYPTRRFRIYFPNGVLPDTSWNLFLHFHDAENRTPLRATLRKSDGSLILFALRDPASSIPRTNLYAPPELQGERIFKP